MKHILLTFALSMSLFITGCKTVEEQRHDAQLTLNSTVLEQSNFSQESKDWGVSAPAIIYTGKYHAPTPVLIPNASTISTGDLLKLVKTDKEVVLLDVLGGSNHQTIPKAHWLKGAGLGKSFDDMLQARFSDKLNELTKNDKSRHLVLFCLSSECWLSYNAALRATKLGYKNVSWYRGGLNAWKAANLPTVMTN